MRVTKARADAARRGIWGLSEAGVTVRFGRHHKAGTDTYSIVAISFSTPAVPTPTPRRDP